MSEPVAARKGYAYYRAVAEAAIHSRKLLLSAAPLIEQMAAEEALDAAIRDTRFKEVV